uniref:site-specific DNA-methyltransferase n=1 Tax=Thiolapillus sp. TaxID=2017437 RepID=UPI003AF92DC8
MANIEKQRERLINLLKELFQLDQPELDFGFYRIMHAKAGQVPDFLQNDLLAIIQDAFGEADEARIAEAKAAWEAARQQAEDFGAPNPDEAPKGKEAKAAYEATKASGSNEGDVYDHLYRFFERYYDQGDFMSRRYFARETDGKAAPYAVPYDGREVYLHWANKDQYYIKTSEYLSNFTFDPTQATEYREAHGELLEGKPLKVHCRIVVASEGEHNNVKVSEQTERYFIIHDAEPVKLETGENGEPELVIQFEYRADPEKTGQEGTWRKKRLDEAAERIKATLGELDKAGDYVTALMTPAPTEKEKNRTLLEKYIAKYAARNTMDYFIHKDLGGFLRRELDFYIKNEVMRLDDVEHADAPKVETWLAKVKVLRKIARHLIDFLAQLEDFQKKLWLKKKFVVDTQYCITLDRIPEAFYPEIAANEAQREEWVRLFFIDELEGYSAPLTVDFLKANDKLVLDTQFFEESFKARLVASIENIDEQCDGVLVHSDNSQALRLLQKRYREQVKCTYIDPPYNTSENAFLYKNTYKHSSWLSMMANGLNIAPNLMQRSSVLMCAIDDTEYSNLKTLLFNTFGDDNYVGTIAAEVNPAGQNIRPNVPARSHDYFHIFAKDIEAISMILRGLTPEERKQYKEKDKKGRFYWDNLRRRGGNSRPTDRPKQWFPLYIKGKQVRVPGMEWSDSDKKWNIKEAANDDETEVWPIDPKGEKRIWRVNPDGARSRIADGEISVIDKAGRQEVSLKSREPEGKKPKTLWSESKYSATSHGTKLLLDILGPGLHFSYPKSIHLTTDTIRYWTGETALVLDFFAGSGTTGHSVINLNREDGGKRKYILAEMGNYFDTVLKPRIAKVIYSKDWKNGKPIARDTGISHCFK